MAIETPLNIDGKEVISKERYPLIAFIGPPGSGKSTLVGAFENITGAAVIREPFENNTFLLDFYKTGENAFECQLQFLYDRFIEMKKASIKLKDGLIVADSTWFGDVTMFEILCDLKHITLQEKAEYMQSAEHIASMVTLPDITIYRREDPEVIGARIIERGRDIEMEMLRWNPNYFVDLARRFDSRIMAVADDTKGLLVLETKKFDAKEDPQATVRECCDRSRYLIEANHDKGLGGIGNDGAKLIIPDFLRPRPIDYAQRSWESARLDRT